MKIITYHLLDHLRIFHYFPCNFTNIDFCPPDVTMFWIISKYRICIAEPPLNISDVSFSIFAAYTSPFALIMFASDTRF
jgi:hypothetical protein